jgi:hypothetical protein
MAMVRSRRAFARFLVGSIVLLGLASALVRPISAAIGDNGCFPDPSAQCAYADLRNEFLRGADMTGADLSGAALTGANLGEARLVNAKLGEIPT